MIVVLDTETTGLDPRADRLVMAGFAIDDDDPVALEHPRDADLIQRFLDLDADFAGHNLGFDLHFLECHGYRVPEPGRWIDTMIVAHVAGERLPGQTALRRLTTAARRGPGARRGDPGARRADQAVAYAPSGAGRGRRDARAPRRGMRPGTCSPRICTLTCAPPGRCCATTAARSTARGRCSSSSGAACRRSTRSRGVASRSTSTPPRELRDHTETTVGDLRARLFELAGGPFNLNAARQIERAMAERGADLAAVPRTPKADLPMFTADSLAAIDDELARTLLNYRAEKKLTTTCRTFGSTLTAAGCTARSAWSAPRPAG